jgi:AraC-like DNA-binding protein
MNTLEISGIVGDIRNALKGLLPNGDISVSNISHSLNISSRSLQRKLLDQSLTYRQVLDDYRRELAIIYIRQPKLSQGEISYQLGFSSPSNFSRAFKNWTGSSPGEYRNFERA